MGRVANQIKRNSKIDFLRLFFAVCIVALHCEPLFEYNQTISYFVSHIASRLVVPFFSAVSGYYFFKSSDSGKYKKTLLSFIATYSVWSGLMFVYELFVYKGKASDFVLYLLKTYFISGWMQLWYLLAIIYLVGILFVADKISHKSEKIIFYISFVFLLFGILINCYGKVFLKLSFLQEAYGAIDGTFLSHGVFLVLPFFMMGYALEKPIPEFAKKHSLILTLCFFVAFFAEVVFTTVFDLKENALLGFCSYPAIYFLMVWATEKPYCKHGKSAKYCCDISAFMYFSHYAIMMILNSMGIAQTPKFIICIAITAVGGAIYSKLKNNVC